MRSSRTALTAGFHSPGTSRFQSWRRRTTVDSSSTNCAQMWSCRRIIQCNSSDLNTVTPEVTERGQNLYKREMGEGGGGGALPRKVCITHLSYLTSSHKLCLSVTSSSCPSCWVMFKLSSWGQSRELTWNFSWQSPHLFCLFVSYLWAASCVFCSFFLFNIQVRG